MPEGDTVHTLAKRFRELVLGHPVESLWIRAGGTMNTAVGQRITAVDAIGKHMLIRFSDGNVLRVHLGLKGIWRRFPPGARLPRWVRTAPVRLETREHILACARAMEVRYGDARRVEARVAHLGPDLTRSTLDWSLAWPAIWKRLRARVSADSTIAELLLDQQIACGIGNIYRSEVLFLERCDPWWRPGAVGGSKVHDAKVTIESLYRRAHELLGANVGPGERVTVAAPSLGARRSPSEHLWVYGRVNERCRVCGTIIEIARFGPDRRSVYYCRSCQLGQTG